MKTRSQVWGDSWISCLSRSIDNFLIVMQMLFCKYYFLSTTKDVKKLLLDIRQSLREDPVKLTAELTLCKTVQANLVDKKNEQEFKKVEAEVPGFNKKVNELVSWLFSEMSTKSYGESLNDDFVDLIGEGSLMSEFARIGINYHSLWLGQDFERVEVRMADWGNKDFDDFVKSMFSGMMSAIASRLYFSIGQISDDTYN